MFAATSKMERFLINYHHKALHLGCCNSPRSASGSHTRQFQEDNVMTKLSLKRPMFASYRSMSIDFQYKLIFWFLYEGNIGRSRIKLIGKLGVSTKM